MAKGKKGKKGRKRSYGGKKKGGSKRRSRRSGGKRSVATPTSEVLYLSGAMVAGEVIAESLLTKEDGDSVVPDMVSPRALGLWAYGYWYRDARIQQMAYALELVHLAESGETDYVEELKDKVSEFRGKSETSMIGPGESEEEESESEEEEEVVG